MKSGAEAKRDGSPMAAARPALAIVSKPRSAPRFHQCEQRPGRDLRAQVAINTITPLLTQTHCLNTFLQHDLLRRLGKTLIGQPSSMRLCPGLPAVAIAPLVTEKESTQLLTDGAHRSDCRQTATDQIAHCFVRSVRHPDRSQQAAAMQDRQTVGIALVVLLPVATLARDHRWRDDYALLT